MRIAHFEQAFANLEDELWNMLEVPGFEAVHDILLSFERSLDTEATLFLVTISGRAKAKDQALQ